MKYLIFVCTLLLLPSWAFAQSVSVSSVSEHSELNSFEFPLHSGVVSVSASQLSIQSTVIMDPLAWSASSEGRKISAFQVGEMINLLQFDYSGNQLFEIDLEFFDATDETISVYQFDDGRTITRDNVANFTFFTPDGEDNFSVSNSSQSPDGERESEFVSDPDGNTMVLFNPVISYGNTTGSRARIVYGDQDNEVFFRSNNKEIKQVQVTSNGSFITILSTDGSNDTANIFDKFGNSLSEINLDGGQLGLSLSYGGEFLTAYSSGRIQVFNTLTGESVGSTSSRNPALFATYMPDDETILIFGGTYNNQQISDPTFTAVHVGLRQIAHHNINISLSSLDLDKLSVNRTSSGQFKMKGLNRDLNIVTSF